ncbi:MAG TPA: pantetheine-phosphate adenylyltransferase [Bacteroidales bacterium]|nr:pantetheine-phosphate adenylyltransferase [Bacteroidales bacterium]
MFVMEHTKRVAVFPGSFDPFTIGHKAILDMALPLFDTVIVAIGINSEKRDFFPIEKRISHIKEIYANNSKVEVETYTSLTIDFCKQKQAMFILRGLRNTTDFQFEKSIAQMNRQLSPHIETVFLVTPPEYGHVTSTIVRELIRYGADISNYIPGKIE